MPRHPVLLATSLCLASLVSPGRGQHPTAPADPASLRRTAHLLAPQDGGLLGLGADFAATFDRQGMTFVPSFGTRVATNQRLQVALRSIRRGDVELPLQRDVAPEAQGMTALYRRSTDVGERYDVRADGVEQSFTFAALPGRGDLVVRCALAGELAPLATTASGGGLQFVLPGVGAASIGAVTGIDADGDRCDGTLRLVDGELELSLPAAFVDRAAMPLVLDPLFGARIDFTNTPGTEAFADVAYAAATGDYLVVWANAQSTTAANVVGRFYHQTTGLGPTVLLSSAGFVQRPKVAYHAYQNRFLVVWEKTGFWLGAGQLTSRIVEGNRALGTQLDLTAAASNCTQADLCGNPGGTGVDTGGLVAYRQAGAGLRILPYTLPIGTAPLVLGTATTLDADPSVDLPHLSKAGTGARVVTYAIAGFVRAQPVDQAGAPLGVGYTVAVGSGNVMASDVDGQGTSFLLAHETPTANGVEITARMLTWNAGNQSLALASTGALTNNTVADRDPVVALLGPKFVVAWTQTVGFLNTAVKARPLATAGCTFCGNEVTLTGPQTSESMPAIAGEYAGGEPTSPQALLVCQSATQLPPIVADVTATNFTVAPGVDTSTPLWSGCGDTITLSTVGPFAIGNSTFAFRVQTATTPALGLFLFGFSGQTLSCGSCTAVNPIVFGVKPLVAGGANYALPLPCDSGFLGIGLEAQAGALGSTTNACPLYPTLSLSPARRFTIVE